ncbi:MAG: hypothetical protein ACRDKT_04030 [Actinomycetota bacterium]
MTTVPVRYPRSEIVVTVGLAFTALFVAWVTWLTNTASYREWAGPLIAVAVVVVSIPFLARVARIENDPLLFRFLLLALVVKLFVAIVRHFLAFEVYDVADAVVYNREGTLLAEQFRDLNFDVSSLPTLKDTDFIKLLTGIIYTFIGPTTWGGFVFFSWMSFWGSVLIHRAFVIGVPGGKVRTFDKLLFFLPSMLYWPASIGKEGWMLLGLGLATLGVAKILTSRIVPGSLLLIVGLWFSWLVRPHVAGFIGIALAGAVLVKKPSESLRGLAPLAKLVSTVIVFALAVVLATQSTAFLDASGIDTSGGVTGALEDVTTRTETGDSKYDAPSFTSPIFVPVAFVTVLYRPFLFEVHNTQVAATALESLALLIFTVIRFRWLRAALTQIRKKPFVMYAFVYSAGTIVALASLGNFGLLARQRALLFPLFLVFFAIPPKDKDA